MQIQTQDILTVKELRKNALRILTELKNGQKFIFHQNRLLGILTPVEAVQVAKTEPDT